MLDWQSMFKRRTFLMAVFLLFTIVAVGMVTLSYIWAYSALQLDTNQFARLTGEAMISSQEGKYGVYNAYRRQDNYRKESAHALLHGVRLLCVVPVADENLQTKVKAVNSTWGPRCDKILYFKDGTGPNGTFVHLPVPRGWSHLTAKVRAAFQHVYDTYRDQFHWILKADDDTYVLVENLKLFLSAYDSSVPSYAGKHFKTIPPKGYMSGGAGYVISMIALRQLVEVGFAGGHCRTDGGYEDIEIGLCLHAANVTVINSLDGLGRERFTPSSLTEALMGIPTESVKPNVWNKLEVNKNCCSEYLISFHDVSPPDMYVFDQLLYRTAVYGRTASDPFYIS